MDAKAGDLHARLRAPYSCAHVILTGAWQVELGVISILTGLNMFVY